VVYRESASSSGIRSSCFTQSASWSGVVDGATPFPPKNGTSGISSRASMFLYFPYIMEWQWPENRQPGFFPVRIDDDYVPCFSSWQVEEFGVPDHWGVWTYRVLETRDDTKFVMDWQMEVEAKRVCRPIHRYNRVERFRYVLFSLVGYKGDLSEQIIDTCRGVDLSGDDVWGQVRRKLKAGGWKKMYNQIPSILRKLGMEICKVEWSVLEDICREFMRMSSKFDFMEKVGRSYFMNLRYVALRMLMERGVEFQYKVPLLQTRRKLMVLDDLWNKLL